MILLSCAVHLIQSIYLFSVWQSWAPLYTSRNMVSWQLLEKSHLRIDLSSFEITCLILTPCSHSPALCKAIYSIQDFFSSWRSFLVSSALIGHDNLVIPIAGHPFPCLSCLSSLSWFYKSCCFLYNFCEFERLICSSRFHRLVMLSHHYRQSHLPDK